MAYFVAFFVLPCLALSNDFNHNPSPCHSNNSNHNNNRNNNYTNNNTNNNDNNNSDEKASCWEHHNWTDLA